MLPCTSYLEAFQKVYFSSKNRIKGMDIAGWIAIVKTLKDSWYPI